MPENPSNAEQTTAASAEAARPSKVAPLTTHRVKIVLIVGASVVGLLSVVLTGFYTVSSFVQTHGSASQAAALTSATDYRFGATKTWQTKVTVPPSERDGSADTDATVQAYPGLWLVTWPGGNSGTSGVLIDEKLLGMNPDTGAVKWSMSPGPFTCSPKLASGALACVDATKASLSVLNPSTGRSTGSPLNGTHANSVDTYKGDLLLGYETAIGATIVDTMERAKLDGTVIWKKSGSCDQPSDDGMQFVIASELDAEAIRVSQLKSNGAFLEGPCLAGGIDLDNGAFDPNVGIGSDGCIQYSPFEQDGDGVYAYGDACILSKYPILIPRGNSTITAITTDAFAHDSEDGADIPTLWSADLPGATLSGRANSVDELVHLGGYALLASAGHLYGIDTEHGPSWQQSTAFAADGKVLLFPIDASKPNTPVVALDRYHDTIERLDPGFGATHVSVEPATLPACPKGLTPVSFSTWDSGKGATLVCQGFTDVVTVVLIVNGATYTSANGSITPTGYYANFGGGISVNVGLGGWATWVRDGTATTLHAATKGWRIGATKASAFPKLSRGVEACPAGTYPLSLSTWHGGWLLTCGEKATTVTRFIYLDGSADGSGGRMTTQGAQSCGTDSKGRRVCVSANPAVVDFTSKSGAQTQHSVDTNYVAGNGFSGAGKGTGAYGLADPAANAASEVAYLNGILQQSRAARSSVKVVVQHILRCASVQADVRSAQAVVADRTTELQALNAAPVDAITGGSSLVAALRAALQYSLRADEAYVTAAGQVAGGGCAAGKATYNAQAYVLMRGTSEKTAFTNAWNSQIASKYGTPTYTKNDI